MKALEIPAQRERLDEVNNFIAGQLELLNCPVKAQMQIELAVEEIFVNIASYAYSPGYGQVCVETEADEQARSITIRFLDRGKPFDPLAKPDADVTLSLEERSIGGLGIHLVKETMDAVEYEYKDGQNILTLRKNV